MKKQYLLAMIALAACGNSGFCADEKPNPIAPYHVQKDPKIMVDPDSTDIFAIPLDEDDEDDEMLIYDLEHPKQ